MCFDSLIDHVIHECYYKTNVRQKAPPPPPPTVRKTDSFNLKSNFPAPAPGIRIKTYGLHKIRDHENSFIN